MMIPLRLSYGEERRIGISLIRVLSAFLVAEGSLDEPQRMRVLEKFSESCKITLGANIQNEDHRLLSTSENGPAGDIRMYLRVTLSNWSIWSTGNPTVINYTIYRIEHNSVVLFDAIKDRDSSSLWPYLHPDPSPDFAIVVFCFSVISRFQFEELTSASGGLRHRSRWQKPYFELRNVLLGVDIELRTDPKLHQIFPDESDLEVPVYPEDGERVAGEWITYERMRYLECELGDGESVKVIVDEVWYS
ncbi:hypothetical protein SISSUDRAFT_1037878 [Sistotremastrum suecicum HHB10207 ss-3]|uniref:Uncharacterized protein n=1 Tax=Sistotremastrum suecicum HHB10207 ss-3 TaxID=1314776 RepID=A0A165XJ08_9AGAM|nr:hypothetical protein SISSUDRAFT_1037878 [Sistotremastrum suecicum HHB10207 ss-3]